MKEDIMVRGKPFIYGGMLLLMGILLGCVFFCIEVSFEHFKIMACPQDTRPLYSFEIEGETCRFEIMGMRWSLNVSENQLLSFIRLPARREYCCLDYCDAIICKVGALLSDCSEWLKGTWSNTGGYLINDLETEINSKFFNHSSY